MTSQIITSLYKIVTREFIINS